MRTFAQSQKMNQDNGDGGGGGYVPADITPGADTTNQPPDSVKQRFSELAEARKQAEARAAQQEQLVAQLIAQNRQLMERSAPSAVPQAPTPLTVEIPEGMDPATANFFQKLTQGFQTQLEAANKRTEQLVAQSTQGVQAQVAMTEMQLALANQPPQVAQLAQQLYQQWQANGYTGWKPSDAITFARGQLGVGGGQPPPGAQRPDPSHAFTPGGAPPPNPRQGTQLPPELPPEQLAKMSLAQEEAYWRKRLEAQGGVDQPIYLY